MSALSTPRDLPCFTIPTSPSFTKYQPGASSVSICAGQSAKLQLNNDFGVDSIHWYPYPADTSFYVSTMDTLWPFSDTGRTDVKVRVFRWGYYYDITQAIFVTPQPTITLTGDSIKCPEQPVTLFALPSDSSYTVTWRSPSGGSHTGLSWAAQQDTGWYYATITTPAGCSTIDSFHVKDLILPNAQLQRIDTTLCRGERLTVTTQAGLNAVTWTDGSQETTRTFNRAGIYFYNYYLMGCGPFTAPEIVLNYTSCDSLISIPNVITPNNDGLNDQFTIGGIEQGAQWSLTVYNRWGQQVYSQSEYNNTWEGGNLPAGTYFYTLNAQVDEQGRQWKGWVQVLR